MSRPTVRRFLARRPWQTWLYEVTWNNGGRTRYLSRRRARAAVARHRNATMRTVHR